ncbi:hypothetical protein HDC95_001404 [Microbacterium sp. AK031]|nr:hypothetical protein [Microbacterium sp. AK031]
MMAPGYICTTGARMHDHAPGPVVHLSPDRASVPAMPTPGGSN